MRALCIPIPNFELTIRARILGGVLERVKTICRHPFCRRTRRQPHHSLRSVSQIRTTLHSDIKERPHAIGTACVSRSDGFNRRDAVDSWHFQRKRRWRTICVYSLTGILTYLASSEATRYHPKRINSAFRTWLPRQGLVGENHPVEHWSDLEHRGCRPSSTKNVFRWTRLPVRFSVISSFWSSEKMHVSWLLHVRHERCLRSCMRTLRHHEN